MTHDDGRQPIAIGHLSYSGDLMTLFILFIVEVVDFNTPLLLHTCVYDTVKTIILHVAAITL